MARDRDSVFKDISTLSVGFLIAQFIPFLVQIPLRRIFEIEVFANYSVYLSAIGISSILTSLRYESAIVIPKEDKDANAIAISTLFLNLIVSIIILALTFLFKNPLLKLFPFSDSYAGWLHLCPIGVWLISSYNTLNYVLVRVKGFRGISVNKVARRSAEGTVHISSSIMNLPVGLILGDLVGNFVNIISAIFQIKKKRFVLRGISVKRFFYTLRKYSDFPINYGITSFFNMVCLLVPILIIKQFYGDEVAGQYDLARTVLLLPNILIARSISQVLLQKTTERVREGQTFTKDVGTVFLLTLVLTLGEMIVILLFSKPLFTLLFGMKWEYAAGMSKILVFGFAANFLASPFSVIFIALRKLKLLAIWQILFSLIILSLYLCKNLDETSFMKLYSSSMVFIYSLQGFLIIFISRKYHQSVTKG